MSRRDPAANKADNCPHCDKIVNEKDMALECEICENWFHTRCHDISDTEYKFLGAHKSVHWYCNSCNKNVASLIKMFSNLQQRQDKIEEDFINLRSDMDEILSDVKTSNKMVKDLSEGSLPEAVKTLISQQIESAVKKVKTELGSLNTEVMSIKAVNAATEKKLETAIEAKLIESVNKSIDLKVQDKVNSIKNALVPTWADVVSKQVDSKFGEMTVDLNRVQLALGETKKMAEEGKDKENRVCNIIIYRIAENGSKDERKGLDKRFCLDLFKDCLDVDVKDEDIKSLFRIGKAEQNDALKPRPLLIQFREKSLKNQVMESLSKLKNSDDRFKNLSISHDMTKNERHKCKTLVEEAKQKQSEEQGEYIFRVRGAPGNMKVVRLRKH